MEERDDVKLEDINAMRYLTNVIKETLRVYNSSIRVGRIATKDCKIGEYFIPKNQMIKTVFNLFHMNEELFPQPNEFRPERFDEKGKSRFQYVRSTFLLNASLCSVSL